MINNSQSDRLGTGNHFRALAGPPSVTVRLKDGKGRPLRNLPFRIIVSPQVSYELCTDEYGRAKLPAGKFEDGKKYKVSFVVSPEYQKEHQIK